MIRFIARFAWQDVTDRSARRTTRVVFLAVAIVCAAIISPIGFALGVDRVSRARLERDPLVRCLWTGENNVRGRITPAVQQTIREKLRARIPTLDGVAGVYPFYNTEFQFLNSKGLPQPPLDGRTITLSSEGNDPLQSSRPTLNGRVLQQSTDVGLVVSPKFWKDLGFDPKSPPQSIKLYRLADDPIDVPIVDTMQAELPTFHLFILTEDYERELRRLCTFPSSDSIQTRPIPKGFPLDPDDLNADAKLVFKARGIDASYDERGGGRVWWILRWKASDPVNRNQLEPSLRTWQIILNELHSRQTNRFASEGEQQDLRVDTSRFVVPLPPKVEKYDMAAIYAPDLDSLVEESEIIPTIVAGESLLTVNTEMVEKVVRLQEQTKLMLRSLFIALGFLLLLAVFSIYFVQSLRADQQIAEIGMLRAMGMSSSAIRCVYLIEGFFIWLPAASFGVLGGSGLVWVCSWAWHRASPEEVSLGFRVPTFLVIGVLLGTILLTMVCIRLASRKALRISPSRALRAAE